MKATSEIKLLIVGVNSFLGQTLADLLAKTFTVTGVYHKNTDNLLTAGVKYVPADKLSELKDEYKAVFFVSAFVPASASEEHINEKLFKVNIALLEMCLGVFPSARFILASSISVYGQQEAVRNERTASIGVNAYGLSKLWAENLLSAHTSYAIIRIASMYGIGMKKNTFLPGAIASAIKKNKITLFGNGSRKQNYIHVSDVAEMMIAASEISFNGIFLAVDLASRSNLEVASEIKNCLSDVQIDFTGEDNSASVVYDATHTYRELNYQPERKFPAEIKNLIEWIGK